MISFIDEHRSVFWVEPICRLLPIAPSTYYENVAKRLDVDRLSVRARSDIGMKIEIRRVFNENFQVYGVRKVWRQLQREGYDMLCLPPTVSQLELDFDIVATDLLALCCVVRGGKRSFMGRKCFGPDVINPVSKASIVFRHVICHICHHNLLGGDDERCRASPVPLTL